MRERKYVKFRVDMYEDTKSKIIDMNTERDVIHYIWTRVVILAGKVNREGELYLSKNSPYTIETLAIEFNRDINQVNSALDVLIELEMIELTEYNVYKVKNFAKHQNIKVKEKNKVEDKNNVINKQETEVIEKLDNKVHNIKQNELQNKSDVNNRPVISAKEVINTNENNKKTSKKRKIDNSIKFIDEEIEDTTGFVSWDEYIEKPLVAGEQIIQQYSFSD